MFTRRSVIATAGSSLLVPATKVSAEEAPATFSQAAVLEDMNVIWTTLRNVSPDPFLAAPIAAVDGAYQRARKKISSSMSVREAWLAIAPVLGSLNDGHVGLGFPSELAKAPLRFPLSFTATDHSDDLFVRRDRSGTISKGCRVGAIEGLPAADFLRTTLSAYGGQTKALARWRVTASGAWTAIALFGPRTAYHVRWIEPSGVEREAMIPATAGAPSHAPPQPYSFSWVQNDVGLIDYRRCEGLEYFKAFLDTTFSGLKAKSAKALIIDVRRNSGGDSALNNLLWTYAQAKPFKQFGGTIERSSERLKRAYGHDRYVQLYGEKAWAAPEGMILRDVLGPEEGLVVPSALPIRFSGPVYLLISTETFSSGMSCALAAKDYGLATLVGQETGEPASGTGELYSLVTPNLGLQAYLTTKVFLAPKPHPPNQGVMPDVVVDESEVLPETDLVMKRTLALIDASRTGADS